jgi:hypothetical protein
VDTFIAQGVNIRTCPHRAIELPGDGPRSKMIIAIRRCASWAAAAKPTGPAPITAIGNICLSIAHLVKNPCRLQYRKSPVTCQARDAGYH